ncbi:cortex morphogenetic protein CmpA [Anaerobacillus arseniciselenatis]|nr:cortex morphogenetic protein CmpA [Anaerobacillus arseniciselenatis]
MPDWLQKQLKNAFREKNLHQIRLLNQCWYYYYRRYEPEEVSKKRTK